MPTPATAPDVSETNELQELRAQVQHLQRLDLSGRIAAGIGHDFNNILLLMKCYAELLEEQPENALEFQRNVRNLHQTIARATRLTDQLLAFSRQYKFEPEWFSPNALVESVIDGLGGSLNKDVYIDLALDFDEPLLFDEVQFEQIFLNLVVNARHAIGRTGHILVELQAACPDASRPSEYAHAHFYHRLPAGPCMVLRVCDTGCGIAPAILPDLVTPFFSTRDKGDGNGLGLAMVSNIVLQHGGCLQVESTEGKGSRFSVWLPLPPGR